MISYMKSEALREALREEVRVQEDKSFGMTRPDDGIELCDCDVDGLWDLVPARGGAWEDIS